MNFFEAVFRGAPLDGYVRVGALRRPEFVTVRDLLQLDYPPAGTRSRDVYFSPGVHSAPDAHRASVIGASVVWLDYDVGGDSIPKVMLPPSIIVSSGGDGRYHLYWMLTEFTPSSELIEGANKAIARHAGEPGNAWDASRILRVPNTYNTKYNPPRLVEIIGFYPERVYPIDDLHRLGEYDRRIWQIPTGLSRSERDFRIALRLAAWGVSKDTIRMVMPLISDKASEEGEHYVNVTVDKAVCMSGESMEVGDDDDDDVVDSDDEIPPKHDVPPMDLRRSKNAQLLANFAALARGVLYDANGDEAGLMLEIIWSMGRREVAATQQDFETRRSVNAFLSRYGIRTCAWLGSDKDATVYWSALVSCAPRQRVLLSRSTGRYDIGGSRLFVLSPEDWIVYPTGSKVSVFWDRAARFSLGTLIGNLVNKDTFDLHEMLDVIMGINHEHVVLPVMGWTLATPFKTILEMCGVRFPILLVHGQRGSGKTSTLRHLAMPLVGAPGNPISADVTQFALLSTLSASRSMPVWLTEFRLTSPNADAVESTLRRMYDDTYDLRGRADLSVVAFHLEAPVAMDCEGVFSDSALRERCVPVRLNQSDLRNNTFRENFRRLVDMEHMLRSFAWHYIRWSLELGVDDIKPMVRVALLNAQRYIQFERMSNSAAILLIGLKLFSMFAQREGVDFSVDYEQFMEMYVEHCYSTAFNKNLGSLTSADELVELFMHAFRSGESWAMNAAIWDSAHRVLWFSLTAARHWLCRFRSSLPDINVLRSQLEERIGQYILPPMNFQGGIYYGIDIDKASEMGLNAPAPTFKGASDGSKISISKM